jgi:hypothetical protein
MRNKATYILASLILILIGCGTDSKRETMSDTATTLISDSTHNGTIELKETFNQEDIPVNDYLAERLTPIRASFRRINSIVNWTTVKTKALPENAEGGEAKFYYMNKQLEKFQPDILKKTFSY